MSMKQVVSLSSRINSIATNKEKASISFSWLVLFPEFEFVQPFEGSISWSVFLHDLLITLRNLYPQRTSNSAYPVDLVSLLSGYKLFLKSLSLLGCGQCNYFHAPLLLQNHTTTQEHQAAGLHYFAIQMSIIRMYQPLRNSTLDFHDRATITQLPISFLP